MDQTKIGIMGLGVVGGALRDYLRTIQGVRPIFLYDPPKGLDEDVSLADVIFISVPVPTTENRRQDLAMIHHCLTFLQTSGNCFNTPIFIKSSVVPGTSDYLAQYYMMKIYAMPEFLTERHALADMMDQDVLVGGRNTITYEHMMLVERVFKDKKLHWMTNAEAELAKYTHNAFAAMKVNYFNTVYQACLKLELDYEKVLEGARISGFIERTHTKVPGPDGYYGYGGKCLPKDLKALIGFLDDNQLPTTSLKGVEVENLLYRGDIP
jgi:nucleotide sugar dehydrogenase